MPYILTSLTRVTYSHLPLLACQPFKAGTHLTGYALHPYFPPYSHLQLPTTTGVSAFQGRHPSHRICPTSLLPSIQSPTATYHYWRVSLSREAPISHDMPYILTSLPRVTYSHISLLACQPFKAGTRLTGYALHPYFPPWSHLQLATYHYWLVSLSRQAPISQDMPYILTSLPRVTYSYLPLLACQPFKAGTPSHRICPTSLLPSLQSPTATYHYWRVSLSRQAPISQDMPYILTSLPRVTYSYLPLLACQPFKAGNHLT